MYGRASLMVAAAAVSACSHAATSGVVGVECHAGATAIRAAGLTGEQACDLVRERIETALAATPVARDTIVNIDLDLSRAGSAIARVRHNRAGTAHSYPDIAVDVMDRDLARDDLVRLADAVTQSILTELQKS